MTREATSASQAGRVLAFVTQWEYECCGTPLDVGDDVELTLTPLDWPSGAGTPVPGVAVSERIEHHIPDDPMRHVRARVTRLWEMRQRLAEVEPHRHAWVPGSESFTPIRHMEVWSQHWQPARGDGRPAGWVVQLDVMEELPPLPDGAPYGAS